MFIVIVVTLNVQIKILLMITEPSGTCMYCSGDNPLCFSMFFNALPNTRNTILLTLFEIINSTYYILYMHTILQY